MRLKRIGRAICLSTTLQKNIMSFAGVRSARREVCITLLPSGQSPDQIGMPELRCSGIFILKAAETVAKFCAIVVHGWAS